MDIIAWIAVGLIVGLLPIQSQGTTIAELDDFLAREKAASPPSPYAGHMPPPPAPAANGTAVS